MKSGDDFPVAWRKNPVGNGSSKLFFFGLFSLSINVVFIRDWPVLLYGSY